MYGEVISKQAPCAETTLTFEKATHICITTPTMAIVMLRTTLFLFPSFLKGNISSQQP